MSTLNIPADLQVQHEEIETEKDDANDTPRDQAVDQTMNNTESDEDPIIREIEVYINRITNPNSSADDTESSAALMYLLQYPLRPIYRPYGDQGRLVKIKHRAHQKTLQMQYTLNMESDNFDPTRRAELLEKQMGQDQSQSPLGDVSHILNSMSCITPNTSYGLGLLKGNRLYITPLSSVLQFRPDFSHVDEEEDRARKRAEEHLTPEVSVTDTSSSSPPDASTKGIKKGKKTIKEEKKDATSNSIITSTQQNTGIVNRPVIPNESEWHRYPPCKVRDFLQGEQWDDVEAFFDPDSPETHEIVQLLTSFEVAVPKDHSENRDFDGDAAMLMVEDNLDDVDKPRYKRVAGGPLVPTIQFSNNYQSYTDRLCSIFEAGTDSLATAVSSGALSFLSLSRLPMDQQVLRVLQHRHVESFNRIKGLITKSIPDDELVLHLRSYGEVILGNWVCKSALIYDGLVAHCRDLLLCLLAMEKPINREKVKPYVGNLSMEKLSDILRELAEYRNNAWHFKLSPDREFISRYPQITKESGDRFNKDAVRAFYEKITSISNAQKQTLSTPSANQPGQKAASGEALGLIDAECLNRAMQDALKAVGAQQPQSLLPLVQSNLKHQAAYLEPAAQRMVLSGAGQLVADDLALILPRIAEDVGCGYWALRKTGSVQIDRHRSVVLSLFKKQTLNKSDENLKGLTRAAILAVRDSCFLSTWALSRKVKQQQLVFNI